MSNDFRDGHPEIEWQQMIGFRNILIHQYHNVDLDIVWNVTKTDIPELIAALKPLVPVED